jgi:hypothetical protein
LYKIMAKTCIKTGGAALAASLLFAAAPSIAQEAAPAPTPVAPGMVRVALKFVRTPGEPPTQPLRLVPESCGVCVQGEDPNFAHENPLETIVELDIPKGRYLEPAFDGAPGAFRRVILQTGDLPFYTDSGRIRVQLPPLEADAVESSEVATQITGDGYVLRFEHADPARRAGAYSNVFPALQRRAANTLEFSLREAVLELGLGAQVKREELGIIEIMGFDTNDPHGHLDAPPHVHMHLRWPYNIGTQIGHFYLTPTGRLSINRVGVTGYHLPERTFGPSQPFATLSPKGTIAYAVTITADGGLAIGTRDGRACTLEPTGAGFDAGAQVVCDQHPPVVVHVDDDLAHGRIVVDTGAMVEVFHYDRDTGALTSPSLRPAEEASGIIPTFHLETP